MKLIKIIWCQRKAPIIATLIGVFLLLAGPGCRTFSESGDASFASVNIQNHTQEEIAQAAAKVFAADGYVGRVGGPGELIFEKAASRGTSLAREGLVSGYYGAQTIVRVKATVVPMLEGGFKLQCRAYMVSGGSDPFFQDEVPECRLPMCAVARFSLC
jgi:hypothetical protein